MVAVAEPRPVSIEVAATLARLTDFLNLEAAWDGESARPPSPAALRNALLFLIEQMPAGPAPAVGPGLDGSIEMEWELPGRPSVSVTFEPDGTVYFTSFTPAGVLREFETRDRAAVAAAVAQLVG